MRSTSVRQDSNRLHGGSDLLLAVLGEVIVVVRPGRRTGRTREGS
jgi:hypothetical protein